MSLGTALITNVVLDAVALGALAYLCRLPARLRAERTIAVSPPDRWAHQREERAA